VTGKRSTGTVGPPRPSVRALELDGDISLYDSATSQALVLNTTASDVWRLLDGEHTLDEVVELLATAYAVDGSMIRPDVVRIIGELTTAGLLPP
jgi:2-keto-3-deoxy-L-rhamnonate aldolase RhmA